MYNNIITSAAATAVGVHGYRDPTAGSHFSAPSSAMHWRRLRSCRRLHLRRQWALAACSLHQRLPSAAVRQYLAASTRAVTATVAASDDAR